MRIALAQITTSRDVAANLELIRDQVARAATAGARLVVLPEASMRAFGTSLGDAAEPLDGPFASAVQALADEHGVTVVLGMFTPGDDGRVRNTLLVAGADTGADEGSNAGPVGYDKIHLYDAFGFRESDTVTAGDEPVQITVDGTRIGLATCYDVRFPALFLRHARAGATVSVVAASWGPGPGKLEQWRLLCRARAIDATSIVLACGQSDPAAAGVDAVPGAPTGVGHSMVLSPFGEVLAEAGGGPELLLADLDLDSVTEARKTVPVLENAPL